MGKVNKRRKHSLIQQKHRKHEKIQKLTEKYQGADSKQREQILARIKKIAPAYPLGGLSQAKK